jgi:hypothetical protein
MKTTIDLRGEDDGSEVTLNKRDLVFMLRMMSATCDGNFNAKAMKDWVAKVLKEVRQ